jgi:hypothetical protein
VGSFGYFVNGALMTLAALGSVQRGTVEIKWLKIYCHGPWTLCTDFYLFIYTLFRSRDSSGSIVSDYGLDDWAIGVRSPAEAKDFSSSLCIQTGSGTHPASCTMGTGGPFPRSKARPGRDADHSPPSSAEVKNE